jgi:hypothetical protein
MEAIAGAQAVHVIEDAERGRDSHDPGNRQSGVQKIPAAPAYKHAENLCANSANQQYRGCQRHAHKQFDLMMEQSSVVKNADTRDERRADEDTHNLGARRSAEGKQHRDHHRGIHRQAAKKRNRREVNFARPRQIDHSHPQRKRAHGNDQHQRRQ